MEEDVIGLIPAGGEAARFGKLSCSKELLPFVAHEHCESSLLQTEVLMSHLIEKMRLAFINRIYVILKRGKWDIPNYFGDGSDNGVSIGYLIQGLPYGVPFTLNQAYHFVMNKKVALGFPDTIYRCNDLFGPLIKRLNKGNVEIVLGIFPADESENADRVELNKQGFIHRIVCKPHKSDSKYIWAAAVWLPKFTRFMREYLSSFSGYIAQKEIQIGQIVQLSIEEGYKVVGVQVSKHPPLDIGNADRLKQLWTFHA